ncbi:MAG: AmmeMemoRadiSam system radical SAM enzyme [bacterium]
MNHSITRRQFIASAGGAGCALAWGGAMALPAYSAEDEGMLPLTKEVSTHEALHYEKVEDLKILCQLCPKECQVADGERGYCGVRENHQGIYHTLVYGRPCTLHIDPIEKKPLFHYRPGTAAFSLATAGCNMECSFCQNWDISQFRPEQIQMFDLPPARTAKLAADSQSPTIAYTYSEPVIYYEYMLDTAQAARELGVGSVMISNGFIQEKPLRQLLRQLTGVKIDFKGFTESFYKDSCKGELQPVLRALEVIREEKVWLELVVLIIPTLNDSDAENQGMAKWIQEHLGLDVPVHLTRFSPNYKLKNIPATPVKTLERLAKIMRGEGLRYVYIGNVPGHPAENTLCPQCGEMVIRRLGFRSSLEGLEKGCCKKCKTPIPGVWEDPLKA